ncbi:MAG: DUF1491 family protein [Sphingomonadaceae bacterium]|uniref:DUF1491 family protein n=1 Tax=Thermaurantiacus sp. TaxID=2820283 RepID=UPI00298EDBE6|nr:DUF1491 family protein [Thermaurantiacus sp.]MCS6987661.1 DUF1491 family protein [Sphingomonadaceae bacterium]MDW8415262.1 DUF1491 family protein [Thermaurantiacus sp.]
MTTPPASLMVPALLRQVSAAGGFATVLHRGHAAGHAVVLVLQPQEGEPRAFERVPSFATGPQWREAARGAEAVARFCRRQVGFDPDLWVVELTVAQPERFIPGFPPQD